MARVSNPNNLRSLQLSELQLLKEIDSFCNKNNIKYNIIGGSLLGAIRHKGFIPWDDDIDIGMARDDFEKFCNLIQKEKNIKFKSFKTTNDYIYYAPIVYDERITAINKSVNNEKIIHPWIDVFPYDGFPDNTIKRKLHSFRLLYLRALINLSAFDDLIKINKKRPLHEKIIIFFGKNLRLFKLLNTKKLLYKMDKCLKKYKINNGKDIVNFMGAYKLKEVIPREYLTEQCLYEFEDTRFPGAKDYDGFLKHFYGDYMKLPPKYERNKHGTEFEK